MEGDGQTKGLSEKKIKRMESKKRKVAAFLDMATSIGASNNKEGGSKGKQKASIEEIQDQSAKFALTEEEKKNLSAEEILQLELRMQQRQAKILQTKASMERPKLFLTPENLKVSIPSAEGKESLPLYMMDLQHLLLFCIQGNVSSFKPRWCKFLRVGKLEKIAVVIVKNASVLEYKNYTNSLQNIFNTFEINVEMAPPCQFGSSVSTELFRVPISNSQYEVMKNVLPISEELTTNLANTSEDSISTESKKRKIEAGSNDNVASFPFPPSLNPSLKYTRLSIILNPAQLVEEQYPIPGSSVNVQSYVYSKEQYDPVTENSPMFGLDVEMCVTSAYVHELTWVSVVNEKLETVYSTLVKPYRKVINYLTKYSGVTKDRLDPVTTRLEDVQRKLREILPNDAIIVGQSLNGDLHALKMFHPYCVDTSIIYNLTGHPRIKTSLKKLTARFLGEIIQNDEIAGHNPTVDAAASLKLALLKLQKGPSFGDVITGGAAALDDGWWQQQQQESSSDNTSKQDDTAGQKRDNLDDKVGYQLSKEELGRRNMFFKCRGLQDDLFRILAENGKTAANVELDDNANEDFKSDWMDVVTLPCSDDSSVYKATKDCVQEKDFVCATLNSFDPSIEDKKESLQKIDDQIKKIYKSTPEKSLFCVVFSGRTAGPGENTNAMTFLRVT